MAASLRGSTILKTSPTAFKPLRGRCFAAEYHGHLAPNGSVRALDTPSRHATPAAPLHHQVLRPRRAAAGAGDFGFSHHHFACDQCLAIGKVAEFGSMAPTPSESVPCSSTGMIRPAPPRATYTVGFRPDRQPVQRGFSALIALPVPPSDLPHRHNETASSPGLLFQKLPPRVPCPQYVDIIVKRERVDQPVSCALRRAASSPP